MKHGDIVNMCEKAAIAGINYEKYNTKLKKEYILKNIFFIDKLMSQVKGYCGSFGTGYPFYALESDFHGRLPIIAEQLRYNQELMKEANDTNKWKCADCLESIGDMMPDLKQICKPCPKIKDSIKPRRVMNRLPDVDMWMICQDEYINEAKDRLLELFRENNMYTTDIDPVGAIERVFDITVSLKNGDVPHDYLPLDIHIIEYSKMMKLLDMVPYSIIEYIDYSEQPYLPIHPISLRKTWQYDDTAYNFILDFLYSLTPFNWCYPLMDKLVKSRRFITRELNFNDLEETLKEVSSLSTSRRYENKQLKRVFRRRMEEWKRK